MADKHDLDHVFMRVAAMDGSMGPRMHPRSTSSHVTVRGLFPGAVAVPYPAWFQDKSGCASGVVLPADVPKEMIDNFGQVRVDFSNNVTSQSRVGRGGCVELSCTTPGSGGHNYTGHLPKLGEDESTMTVGDRVVVTVSVEELEVLQRRHGLPVASVSDKVGVVGIVREKTDVGDLEVKFNNIQDTFTINPAATKKLHSFCAGRTVRLHDDLDMVRRLQNGHGGWSNDMKLIIGKTGRVLRADGMDVHVEYIDEGRTLVIRSINLVPVKPRADPDSLYTPGVTHYFAFRVLSDHLLEDPLIKAAIEGNVENAKQILTEKPELVHWKLSNGKTIINHVAGQCSRDILKLFVEFGAFVDLVDSDRMTPLMNAILGNRYKNVKYLLEKGADVNLCAHGLLPLSMTCFSEARPRIASLLIEHGADVNQKSPQSRPFIHAAIGHSENCKKIFDVMVERTETDMKLVENKFQEMVVQKCIEEKQARSIQKLLEKVPRLAGVRDGKGLTPLMFAASHSAPKIAEIVIKTGYHEINAQEPTGGYTALHIAAIHNCSYDLIDILIKNGADPNIHSKAETVLQLAFEFRQLMFGKGLVPNHPILDEMKEKWRHLGIRTNGDAYVAYYVWNGLDPDLAINKDTGISGSEWLKLTKDRIAPAINEINRQRKKQKLWLEKLQQLEEKEIWLKEHPLIPAYRPRLSDPDSCWLTFFRQRQAFECTNAHPQDVHVFAFEPENTSSSKSSPGKGLRKFLVTSYAQLWHTVKSLASRGQHHGSFYEVIPEGAACKLYFDLEFSRDLNPDLDGGAMVQTLIQLVNQELNQVFGLHCNPGHVINLDASTGSKFSCHLIYNIPGAIFKDNIHAGNFVRHVCSKITEITASSDGNSEQDQEEPPTKKRKDDAPRDGDDEGERGCRGNGDKSEGRGETRPREEFKERLEGLYINVPDGERELFIDMAVYTRNRNFRLYKCVKLGKENPLLVAPGNAYHVKTNAKKGGVIPGGEDHQLFLDSIISNARFTANTRVLTYEGSDGSSSSQSGRRSATKGLDFTGRTDPSETVEGYQSSPFPAIDTFVREQCISRGGVAGEIRRWTYFSQAQLLVYDIVRNRWCENIGRQHRGNNIMILVDLRRGMYYQKCHDPACRAQGFKSPERDVSPEFLPSFTDWDDEELMAITEQVELDAEDSKKHPAQERDSEGNVFDAFEDECTDEELIKMAEQMEAERPSSLGQPSHSPRTEEQNGRTVSSRRSRGEDEQPSPRKNGSIDCGKVKLVTLGEKCDL